MDTIQTETSDPHDAIRAEVRRIMETEGLSQVEVARMADVKYGTFTPWMGGTYLGRNETIAEKVSRWIETRANAQKTKTVLPAAPTFIATPTAESVSAVITYSHAAPDFGVVVGGAGIGKTTAIEEYQRRNSNVFVWTAEPSLSSTNSMLSGIAEEMGLMEGQASRLSKAIISRVKNAAALIVVDEAQHLRTDALDQLRTIQDKAKCGIVVSGNESLLARLKGGANAKDALFAQLHSRVGMRMLQPKAKANDITLLLAAWEITDPAQVKLLTTIARKPGALRVMTRVIRLASMYAAGAGDALTAAHVRNAFSQISSTLLDDDAA